MHKSVRMVIFGLSVISILASTACAKVPESSNAVTEVPLPAEIDDMDASKLVASDVTQNCRKAPSIKTASKHKEYSLASGGVYGTYDWPAGKTNGGQIWKTRLSYVKSNLAQVHITPTYVNIGNVGSQIKLAKKVDALGYVNGDFFNLRGTNNLFSAMIDGKNLVYAPKGRTSVVGVAELDANEHTGMQGSSFIKVSKKKIKTQGLNLIYLDKDAVGAYSSIKTTQGLPDVEYVVYVKDGSVVSSKESSQFEIPKRPTDFVFVAKGAGVQSLSRLKVGDKVSYTKPESVKTAKFIRTWIESAGEVILPSGEALHIDAVNHNSTRLKSGVVLYTPILFPKTTKGSFTVVTDLSGKIQALYPKGKAVSVVSGQQVIQIGPGSIDKVAGLKIGEKLKIRNDYKLNRDIKLVAAFGNRHNLMVDGIVIASCSPSLEDIRPRNVVAWNENGDVWFGMTTMGVRNSADVFNRFRLGGSSVHQLTAWLKELGATQATMLDGGGSATMYVKDSSAKYIRVDLPASEWVRSVPQGITMVAR